MYQIEDKLKSRISRKQLRYKMRCPMCGKRAFDISEMPADTVIIELKCPNCRNIVEIQCGKNTAPTI
jgi:transcription elongation factor Elf1